MESSKKIVDSIAIGRFDGFHLGHKGLFQALTKNGAILIIYRKSSEYILPYRFTKNYVDYPIFRYDLDDIRDLDGRQFLEKIFLDFPNLKKIVVGYDFFFGRGRGCSAFDLKNSCRCKVEIIDEVKFNGISIHSGEIIRLLKSGDIESANQLLGRPYSIIGKHIKGQGIGGKLLVPTINIEFQDFVIPKNGVYLTKTHLENGKFFSISFIGKRETTDGNFALETHILDRYVEENNNTLVKVEFIDFIRENRQFQNLQELKMAIDGDVQSAKEILNHSSNLHQTLTM